jgi:hypothetical protein
MTAIPVAIRWVVGFLLGAVALGGFLARHDANVRKDALAQQHVEKLDYWIAQLAGRKAVADTVYLGTVRTYRETRDAAIAANPTNKPLADLAGRCDQVILSCEQRVAIADTLADSMRAEVRTLKAMRKVSLPRLSLYGEGLYDFLNQGPVARAGADFRLFGGVSLTGAIEAVQKDQKTDTRAMIGARFTFR